MVIVGARCAGASLATFLARRGIAVLAVDKDPLPSEQVLSTHTVHPPGMDVLDELGVGDAVRAVSPPMKVFRLAKGASALDIPMRPGRAERCPRRKRLDGLIQDAARAAGAEVRDRTRVVGLLRDGERVTGVRLRTRDGEESVDAGLVVGADGRKSTVAEEVEAGEYLAYDAPRGMYWSYWDTPPVWRDRQRFPFDMYVGHLGGDIRAVFETDDDQLLIASLPPVQAAASWSKDAAAALRDNLASDPVTGPLVAGKPPAEPVRGVIKERYFFRRAAGPGWVLVGDAGHHKEFVIGDGITEALLQARSLAAAIAGGGDAALLRWWRERDVEALPLACFGRDEGSPGPPPRLQERVFAQMARRPAMVAEMPAMVEHEVSPYDTISPLLALRCVLAATLRGEPRCIKEFFTMARRGAEVGRELARRRQLLAEAT
ncbi:MAG: FAD-dependent monooxygenase [Acidobacteriota bacterium]